MDEMEQTIEKQDALRAMDDRIMAQAARLLHEGQPTSVLDAVKRLVVGLRLCAVCPKGTAAQFNAWVSLSRAWRELGLPEGELEAFQNRAGYSTPPG